MRDWPELPPMATQIECTNKKLPVSSAQAECLFSCMNFIKSTTRLGCSPQNMNWTTSLMAQPSRFCWPKKIEGVKDLQAANAATLVLLVL
jgi:hypothetical protein